MKAFLLLPHRILIFFFFSFLSLPYFGNGGNGQTELKVSYIKLKNFSLNHICSLRYLFCFNFVTLEKADITKSCRFSDSEIFSEIESFCHMKSQNRMAVRSRDCSTTNDFDLVDVLSATRRVEPNVRYATLMSLFGLHTALRRRVTRVEQ